MSCWRSSTPFDLFYADNPTDATQPVNDLGRTVGIKRLSAYTKSCRYRHDPVENRIRPVCRYRSKTPQICRSNSPHSGS